MTKRTMTPVVAGLLLALAAPAQADTLEPHGRVTFSGQLTSSHGLLGAMQFQGGMDVAELGATLMAPPANPLSFFTADAYLAFVGHTGSFLPINLKPVMGFGMAANFRDITTGTRSPTDINMWMYMPVGLRYGWSAGGLSLGAEALYHLPAVYMIKGATDPARWHFEVSARTGPLLGGVYYELGPVYNGPGARFGLSF